MNRNYVAITIGIISLGLFVFAAHFVAPQTDYRHARVTNEEYERIVSERKESNNSMLHDLKFNDRKVYFAEKDNTWYYSIVEEDSNAYNPHIKTNGNHDLKIAFKNNQNIDESSIADANALDFIVYDDAHYSSYKLAITTLPIIEITHEDEISHDNDTGLKFELFDNRKNTTKRITQTVGDIHYRGRSSTNYDKKSYRLNLRYKSPGEHDRNANEPLLGMREDDDWILYTPYNDSEKVRNVFSEQLWRAADQDNATIRGTTSFESRYVELIENEQYYGLYVLMTTIDEKSLGLEKDKEGNYDNYIFKKESAWKLEDVLPGTKAVDTYEIKSKSIASEKEAWGKLRDYLYNSLTLRDADYIRDHSEMNNLADISIFENLIQNTDAFTQDDSGDFSNFYLSNIDTHNGEQFIFAPWDFDASWGRYYDSGDVTYEQYPDGMLTQSYFVTGPLFEENNNFKDELDARYAELRTTNWSNDKIMELIDQNERDVYRSGAYLREKTAWPSANYIRDEEPQNLDHFRAFVKKRIEYMDYYYNYATNEPTPLEAEWVEPRNFDND